MLSLQLPIQSIPRVSPKYLKPLNKIGLKTVEDLLRHFPFRYDDYSQIVPIDEQYLGQVVTIQGQVIKSKINRIFKRRMTIVEITIMNDNEMPLKAVWFNQPYILENMKVGSGVRLSGKLTLNKNRLSMSNPAWERMERETTNTGRLVPVYPETAGLTSKWIRWQIQLILKNNFDFTDPLPEEILEKLKLPDFKKAIQYIHFPENKNQYLLAQKRFAFEEMFLLQLKSLQVRASWEKEKSVPVPFEEKLIQKFVSSLPFQLTDAQRKASFQILKDLEKDRPMNRLLNGDVGSGKTIVAAIASLQAVKAGLQVAIMAPTEVLARQHYLKFSKLLSSYKITTALLTNAYQEISHGTCLPDRQAWNMEHGTALNSKKKNKDNLLSKIKSGEINLIIGTHALIQKSVKFNNLALIIVDEQHRFGVSQRAYLQQQIEDINDGISGKIPHLLTMTATPIPRTLALAFFGNLDLSVLDEMPKNRKKIITQIIPPTGREKIYEFIRSEIKNGRQCFVILPLVEESKVLTEVKAAVAEYKILSEKVFPNLNIGLIHGKLKSEEKEKAMQDFADCKTKILVATAVVEVGIDIPNASVMIIEDADRFGLSQLHQFRGRIGRGDAQSYCFLFSTSSGETATARLKALAESENGFEIAEKDLKLRGPGEFLGTRQSGLPDIAMENLANVKLIQISREEAQNILKADWQLKKHPLLASALQKFNEKVHLE
jgi:ATP-dependent DNA helicase RecG